MPNPALEKQPQSITSADKKLQIINHSAGGDQFGCYMVKGAVRNISPESNIGVELRVEYFDINGKKIDSEVDVFEIPMPGGSRGFHIVYPGQRYDDIKGYTIYPFSRKAN
jgi:hypothetical protein